MRSVREEVGNLFYVRLGYGAGSPGHEKTPPPGEGGGANFNMKLNEVELLATTENQSESTEAEKGCGGWFWNDTSGDGDVV